MEGAYARPMRLQFKVPYDKHVTLNEASSVQTAVCCAQEIQIPFIQLKPPPSHCNASRACKNEDIECVTSMRFSRAGGPSYQGVVGTQSPPIANGTAGHHHTTLNDPVTNTTYPPHYHIVNQTMPPFPSLPVAQAHIHSFSTYSRRQGGHPTC